MNWTLEVVCVPVTDVDRAKTFYADTLGFNVDHDTVDGGDADRPADTARARGARSASEPA